MIPRWTSVLAAMALGALACGGKETTSADAGAMLELTSPALTEGKPIPAAYACTDYDHLGKSPPLSWTKGPDATASYAVTVVDPDAGSFVHWALVDVPPTTTSLPEGVSPGGALPAGARELDNGFAKPGYGGPCPPPGEAHHYVFTVTALPAKVSATQADAAFLSRLEKDGLARSSITVTFQR